MPPTPAGDCDHFFFQAVVHPILENVDADSVRNEYVAQVSDCPSSVEDYWLVLALGCVLRLVLAE